ncbi:DSD1 family PLP-dependent enzyme [Jannaschia sp. 2305UL9-9]|uniref:DSD1 family PLP-dependent enzyme n=1 Tax=Jannaschia sp. 2305UL9-9 TaxID=3121638 RepID=UPI0035274F4E
MGAGDDLAGLEVGYDIPALPGMTFDQVQTPCLILDLDALERNVRRMGDILHAHGVRHRSHGKMHKSVDVQRLQQDLGGACGVCCQKVSEAEAFARGGITDILVSNQVTQPAKIARLAALPHLGARIICCVDDAGNIAALSAAAVAAGTTIECLVEVECGARRCGVVSPAQAVDLARLIAEAAGLRFAGVQVYQGAMQHLPTHEARREAAAATAGIARRTVTALTQAGLSCDIIGGGGTGSFPFDVASGVFNEVQCGSYAFMDADYGRLTDSAGERLDADSWHNALFVLTSVMSVAQPGLAIVDAGHKAHAVDSGLPTVFGRPDLIYADCSDEHGNIRDPDGTLSLNDLLRLVPGHCDPTCNLHDWYVGMRGDRVEVLWPVTARGKGF